MDSRNEKNDYHTFPTISSTFALLCDTHIVCTSKCNTTITTNYSGTIGFHYLFKTYFFQWFNAQKKLKCKSQKKFKEKKTHYEQCKWTTQKLWYLPRPYLTWVLKKTLNHQKWYSVSFSFENDLKRCFDESLNLLDTLFTW